MSDLPSISRDELFYLAGLFDGEGCIHIACHNHWKNAKSSIYVMTISLNNTNESIVRWIHTLFGGSIRRTVHPSGKRKPLYEWRVNAMKAEIFLKNIHDFLRIKQEHAEIALAYRATFEGAWRPNARILKRRNECLLAMKRLNKKG